MYCGDGGGECWFDHFHCGDFSWDNWGLSCETGK